MSQMTEYQSPLPSRHSVRNLIEDLVGRQVEFTDGDPLPTKPTNAVAVYVNDQLNVSALAVVTLEGAAYLGGALGLLPKGGVEDAIDEKELPPVIRDNCYEVLNVLAAVFNLPNHPHVRLYEMYAPGEALPADIAAMVGLLGQRLDVNFEVSGYGRGGLSIVIR